MKCPDDETLAAFADGELDDALWADIERHIDACGVCRERFQAIGQVDNATRQALAALKASAPPMTLAPAKNKARLLARPFAVAAAAAIVIAAAIGGVWFAFHERSQAHKPAVIAGKPPEPALIGSVTPRQAEPSIPVTDVVPLACSSEEYKKRIAEAKRSAVMPVDSLPEWKVDELRRIVAARRGSVPEHDG